MRVQNCSRRILFYTDADNFIHPFPSLVSSVVGGSLRGKLEAARPTDTLRPRTKRLRAPPSGGGAGGRPEAGSSGGDRARCVGRHVGRHRRNSRRRSNEAGRGARRLLRDPGGAFLPKPSARLTRAAGRVGREGFL
nr:transmembrane protein 263 isoform X1 [Pogona vitticeps]